MGKFKITKETENIHCRVRINDNKEADGTIIRQKASKKFLVTDGTNTGTCIVSDLDDNKLMPSTMTLTVEKDSGELCRVEYLSNKFAMDFNKNRFIVTGASTHEHNNATVLTDEAKAKLSKPKTEKKKPVAKKKKTPKAPAKKAVVKSKTPEVKKTVSTSAISEN